jgi:hypothetical protein
VRHGPASAAAFPPSTQVPRRILIADALPFGGLWYLEAGAAISYAKHRSRSHDAVIRVYDDVGNVIETHERTGDFKGW